MKTHNMCRRLRFTAGIKPRTIRRRGLRVCKASGYLLLNGEYIIELFSFPDPPEKPTNPEATGLRHLAFEVDNISDAIDELDRKGIDHEPLRTDGYTGKRFVFFRDPDCLPIELYEK